MADKHEHAPKTSYDWWHTNASPFLWPLESQVRLEKQANMTISEVPYVGGGASICSRSCAWQ